MQKRREKVLFCGICCDRLIVFRDPKRTCVRKGLSRRIAVYETGLVQGEEKMKNHRNSLFDMHCHIVPGVDDGAKNVEVSMAMLRMEYEDGVRGMIITPHYRRGMFETSPGRVHESFQKLQIAARKEYPDLTLYLGCELHSNMELAELLASRPYLTMADSSYVLLEFSEHDSAKYIRERVHHVLSLGYNPILAHVERYEEVRKNFGFAEDLVSMGADLQVNAGSILGKSGWKAKRFCRKLMEEGLLGFVGSDAHDTKNRAPDMGDCAGYVAKKMGEAYADMIFREHPMRIIADGQNKK